MSDLDKCKKYLRSILLASKGGVPAGNVFESYKDMVGEGIPYRKFNYQTLEQFLQSMPDVCRITARGRDIVVVGVANNETHHIGEMVRKQGGKSMGGSKRGSKTKAPDMSKFYSVGAQYNNGPTSRKFSPPAPVTKKPTLTNTNNHAGRIMNMNSNNHVGRMMNGFSNQTPSGGTKKVSSSRPSPRSSSAPINYSPAEKSSPVSPVSGAAVTRQSIRTWTGRVKKILEGKPFGLWKTQVEKFHEKQWSESLPSNWTSIMLEANLITLKNQSTLLVVCLKTANHEDAPATQDEIVPSGVYPGEVEWIMTITHVVSTSHYWVMFGDAPKKLDNLQSPLEWRHRSGPVFSGGVMPPGNYFSAKLQTGRIVRVKVTKVDRINYIANCFLLDYGREEKIKWSNLTPLHQEFLTLPSLAKEVVLSEVSDSKDPELVDFVKNKLVGSKMKGLQVDKDENDVPVVPMFDEDINVADYLNRHLNKSQPKSVSTNNNPSPSKNVVFSNSRTDQSHLPRSSLPVVGEDRFYDCKIRHIVSSSEIYVQSYSDVSRFSNMTKQMNQFYESRGDRGEDSDQFGSMFAIRRHGDWMRAEVICEIR